MTLIAAALLFLAASDPIAAPVAAAPAVSEEQIERLSKGKVELWSRIGALYFANAEGQAFFRDAGPFKGCDAYNEVLRTITSRHYPAFREQVISVYRSILPAPVAASARMSYLSPELYGYSGRLRMELDHRTAGIADSATADLAVRLHDWLVRERLQGARLGVKPDGSDFWHNGNHAIIGLVCASPNDEHRRQVIGTWFRG